LLHGYLSDVIQANFSLECKLPCIPSKELRELTKLKKEGYNASFHVRQDELDMGMTESSKQELKGAHGRPKTRIDALLRDVASADQPDDGKLFV
jgi:hypothetical protein